jgi:hypothetical protein
VGAINLSNSKGRDALVSTHATQRALKVRWLDEQGRQAHTARIVKADLTRDVNALAARAGGMDKVAQSLIDADPEIDLEMYGSLLRETKRVYIDPEGKVVHKVQQFEVILNPDGTERERRPRVVSHANVAEEMPLRWTGKLIKKSEAYNKFVFSGKRQIVHVNGLTFDFLFGIAKELHDTDSLMLMGAGPKGAQPLVFQRGGQPYRAFLEGKVNGDRYMLVMHLSNMELKAPPTAADQG